MGSRSERDPDDGVATKHAAEDGPRLPRASTAGDQSTDTSGVADYGQGYNGVSDADGVAVESADQVTEAVTATISGLESIKEEVNTDELELLSIHESGHQSTGDTAVTGSVQETTNAAHSTIPIQAVPHQFPINILPDGSSPASIVARYHRDFPNGATTVIDKGTGALMAAYESYKAQILNSDDLSEDTWFKFLENVLDSSDFQEYLGRDKDKTCRGDMLNQDLGYIVAHMGSEIGVLIAMGVVHPDGTLRILSEDWEEAQVVWVYAEPIVAGGVLVDYRYHWMLKPTPRA